VSLRDAGSQLLERLRPAMDQIIDAVESLNAERGRPHGTLRLLAQGIAACSAIAAVFVSPSRIRRPSPVRRLTGTVRTAAKSLLRFVRLVWTISWRTVVAAQPRRVVQLGAPVGA
jgi:DNA-binding transcriptional LysR family regulator